MPTADRMPEGGTVGQEIARQIGVLFRQNTALLAENERLRTLLSNVMDTPRESRGWSALYAEIRSALKVQP